MNIPRQEYYPNLYEYWAIFDAMPRGQRPPWYMDFISIHPAKGGFKLIGPSFVFENRKDGHRLRAEKKLFESFEEAKTYALRLAAAMSRVQQTHVVNTCQMGGPDAEVD